MNLCETERGNIWIINTEDNGMQNAYIKLVRNDEWLEIITRPSNYPGLCVSTIRMSEKELAKHITSEFGGGSWLSRKMNIDGVCLTEDNIIIGNDGEEIVCGN